MIFPLRLNRAAATFFVLFMMASGALPLFGGIFGLQAQDTERPRLSKDTSYQLEIPSLRSLAASNVHLYALSDTDGLVVFRVHADSLQWLYSSEGMQRRGTRLQADTRFAYLTGRNNRLTVVEPTSILGIYSSTELPSQPGPVLRKGDDLFFGMSAMGLYRLSLRTPDEVDQRPDRIAEALIGRERVIALQSFGSRMLVLTSGNHLHQFRVSRRGQAEHEKSFRFGPATSNLFIIDGQPLLTGTEGTVYEIGEDDELRSLFRVNGAVEQLLFWNGIYLARTIEGEVWEARPDGSTEIFRRDARARNEMIITKGQLWMSDYEQVSRIRLLRSSGGDGEISTGTSNGAPLTSLTLQPIEDRVVPFPRPVLIPIQFEEEAAYGAELSYRLQSSVSGATIRQEGFFWQPASRNVGRNNFTIVASTSDGIVDSTSFTVDVRPFNRPPRFNPVRPLSIPVGEEFVLPLRASDPDGLDAGLIRYMGVDLPTGARLDERTGQLLWTPSRRQAGEHDFRVIATDQYGAATSLTVRVNVLELERN